MYLMIQNEGVAPPEAFTVVGASTSRQSSNSGTIGCFGSGNKFAICKCLRDGLSPIVFCDTLRLTFSTEKLVMGSERRADEFGQVVVRYTGKDAGGSQRNYSEKLGFVKENGAVEWNSIAMALREFVSNAIDRQIEVGETRWCQKYAEFHTADYVAAAKESGTEENLEFNAAFREYVAKAQDFRDVEIRIVEDNQVRAKAGCTRVFVPLNDGVKHFFDNIGLWFLHFSEPDNLGTALLSKNVKRNFTDKSSAVIYRRGVRVREITTDGKPALFDYNLNSIQLDEARNVTDWSVTWYVAEALAKAGEINLNLFWRSFRDDSYWEHGLTYLKDHLEKLSSKEKWNESFRSAFGGDAVLVSESGDDGERVAHKGYKAIEVPLNIVEAIEVSAIPSSSKILSEDDRLGRDIFSPTNDAIAVVEYLWGELAKAGLIRGRQYPEVRCFRQRMNGGRTTAGFYRDNTIFLSEDLTTGQDKFSHELLITALEELVHHVTGSTDMSRDFQEFCLDFIVLLLKGKQDVESSNDSVAGSSTFGSGPEGRLCHSGSDCEADGSTGEGFGDRQD